MGDLQHLLDGAFALLVGIGAWIMNGMRANQKDLFQRMDEMPSVYARRDDMRFEHDRMTRQLNRIEEKLDRLVEAR